VAVGRRPILGTAPLEGIGQDRDIAVEETAKLLHSFGDD
jgi:hypothetical protein